MRRAAAALLATLTILALSSCGSPAKSKAAPLEPASTAAAASATGEPAVTPSPSGPGSSPSGKPSAKPSTSPSTSRSPSRSPGTGGLPKDVVKRTGSDSVALTFDDGPDPVNTPPLLDVLKQNNVKATFCLVGFRARDYPAIVKRIADEGHTLCNHTWQHLQDFSTRDDSYVRWDLKATNDAILAAAPGAKIKYFRAPYGNFNTRLDGFAAELRMKPIHWEVDDESWRTDKYGVGPAMIDRITKQVQNNTRRGSIVLSHDNKKPWTATAYASLIPWLKARFELIGLPE
jgi:peptidoglycan/xylan/chitin deacetylase (PgdA/CDA1 family)